MNRKVMITEDEAERFAEATLSICAAFGSQVTYSQITRALWALAGPRTPSAHGRGEFRTFPSHQGGITPRWRSTSRRWRTF